MRHISVPAKFLWSVLLVAFLTACADGHYLLQSVRGHMDLLHAARPVDQWLADPETPAALKSQLALAEQIRRFAVTELGLPDNASYQRYADLKRRAVVWNVVAAPEWSLTLKTWCFPVAGCVGYRGYFDEAQARALAFDIQAQGFETSVYGVPAYSTLGWMNWAGGDPLLNTFVHYPEGELARMIFHELAHQVLYVKDDTVFNESFATAVERLGSARWLALRGSPSARADAARWNERRAQFRALTRATREALQAIYQQNSHTAPVNASKLAIKKRVMEDFRSRYKLLKTEWVVAASASGGPTPDFSGYDHWVAHANNAAFGAQAAYDALVPGFEFLFEREAQAVDGVLAWQRFYDVVRRLADQPAAQRAQSLGQFKIQRETNGG